MPNASDTLVYVIDRDEAVRDSLRALIESNGFRVRDFATKEAFLLNTETNGGSCLVLGFNRYGAEAAGSLEALRKHRPDLPVIFVVGPGGASLRAAGAADAFVQLERPVQEATLIRAIRRAVEH